MFKIIVISTITLYFLFQLFLNILKYKNRKAPIPEELSDVYDEATYLKWKEYSAEKIKIHIVSDILTYIMNISLIVTNVFSLIVANINNDYVSAIIILAIYIGISTIIDVIISYFDNMKIEEKYGFNKASMKTFVGDQIKGLLLSSFLLIGLTCLFIILHKTMGDYILILFSGIVFLLILFIGFIYPYISRVSNKFTPLEEGELRTSLIKMLESHNYQVRDIKVMDASRRTSKSNAYFTGYGKSKTIVLFDNLLNVMNDRQILAIFAHEMGHGIHKDTLKSSLVSLLNIIIFVTFAWLLVKFPEIYKNFGFDNVDYGFGVILLMNAVLPFVSTLLGFFSSYMSKRADYRADGQAFKEGYAEDLIVALKVLFRENFGDLNPPKLIVLLSYSHPTLLQRINHIRELESKNPS